MKKLTDMLVPAMTPIEIYKEIIEDGLTVIKTITTKLRIQTHLMKRTNNFKWVETLHIKTARQNNWSIIMNINGTVHDTNMYVKTNDKFGITAYNFFMIEDIPVLVKYNSHFFKRYRERMELDEAKPDQVIKKFFRNNIRITPAYSEKDEKGNIMACMALPEGIGLGRFSENSPITEMKTFIAHSTLNKGQRELVKTLNEDEFYQEGITFIGE